MEIYNFTRERRCLFRLTSLRINKSLNDLIKIDDEAVITAETNKNLFVQWALIFNKNHKILEQTLINILKDVSLNKTNITTTL